MATCKLKLIELLGVPKASHTTTKERTVLIVNVAKAERSGWMAYGQILSAVAMDNQQRSLEQRNVQRLRACKHRTVVSIQPQVG